jgi:glycerol-3-phosphate cytidylyltransferase
VIPESDWKQKIEDIKRHEIDTFVMGDDWQGKFDELRSVCEVVYLARTEGVSTTSIKGSLKGRSELK